MQYLGLVATKAGEKLHTQNSGSKSKPKKVSELELFQYGTIGKLINEELSFSIYGNFRKESRVIHMVGIYRFKVNKYIQSDANYIIANVTILPEESLEKLTDEQEKSFKQMQDLYCDLLDLIYSESTASHKKQEVLVSNPSNLTFIIAQNLTTLTVEQKQSILEATNFPERVKLLVEFLQSEINERKFTKELDQRAQESMKEENKKFFLKKKMQAISEELWGKGGNELSDLEKKIEASGMPEAAKKVTHREFNRLRGMQPHNSEYHVIMNYLETMCQLPWQKETEDNIDVEKAQEILDRDHFGLQKVKRRIIEYLAVRSLKKDLKGPIICLHGPPGVGKTSLGKSIAESLNRKFDRMSLGGVHDEAQIRGHRKTYIGSMPGLLIDSLQRCQTKNPVILLDEIDKLSRDFRGDPSSAMLEVLDPSQNHSFVDNFIATPFDLSNVMFIATANRLDTIQPALLDRMEVINLSGYTIDEKENIARRHLIPKQIKANGIDEKHLKLSDSSLQLIITGYTAEAGVRSLERCIGSICRHIAVEYSTHQKKNPSSEFPAIDVDEALIRKVLGIAIQGDDLERGLTVPGVAIGMAWTATGGSTLFVETSKSPGRGKIELTGQLGGVMKESVVTAVSWIRTHADMLGLSPKMIKDSMSPVSGDDNKPRTAGGLFDEIDLHIHFPAAAIPKDGPSAGVTIVTALVSLLTNRLVRSDVAMTGEISLKGNVLPVGGIKEKCMAAHRNGIKKIIIPIKNKNDVEELSEEVKKSVEFVFATKVSQVLKHALETEVFHDNEQLDADTLFLRSKM